ncbi:MAG: cbb3-type cytochrome c oxidase subunit I [Verrucomicrobiales bacterium]
MAENSHNADPKDIALRADIDRSLRHPVMFFFTSGAAWLAVAVFFGLIASAKKHSPEFLSCFSWFDSGKIDAAHMSALVYGWACQAAFGVLIWLMSRLARQNSKHAPLILVAGHIWNFVISLGLLAILMGKGSGVPLMEFPPAIWPVLFIAYLLIVSGCFVSFQFREGGHVYISQWYLLAAMFWFPWIFASAHLFAFNLDAHPLMVSAVAAWYKSALVLLFFIPVALAAAYYLAPKVTGRPVYSYSLALFGFWALAVVGPWAGMQKLAGAPIPAFLPYVGAAAAVLVLIPALTVSLNILKTIKGHGDLAAQSPSLRFTVAGIIAFLIFGVLSLLLNTTGTLRMTQFSITNYGFDILAFYGVFSLCAYGAIYFIVPRITKREWLSRRLINWHFYLSLYGVVVVVGVGLLGGYMQGIAGEAWDKPWKDAATLLFAMSWGTTIAWVFLSISNVFFCLHLLLMWARLGRRSSHPTLLAASHAGSPHGPEGEIDNYASLNA